MNNIKIIVACNEYYNILETNIFCPITVSGNYYQNNLWQTRNDLVLENIFNKNSSYFEISQSMIFENYEFINPCNIIKAIIDETKGRLKK